jgi:hypothetical protein
MVETINIAVNSDYEYSCYTRKLCEARTLKPGERATVLILLHQEG